MCIVCTEWMNNRMSIYETKMALIELRGVIDKEHVAMIEQMISSVEKLNIDTETHIIRSED